MKRIQAYTNTKCASRPTATTKLQGRPSRPCSCTQPRTVSSRAAEDGEATTSAAAAQTRTSAKASSAPPSPQAIPDDQIFPGFSTVPRRPINTSKEFVSIGAPENSIFRMKQLLRQTVRERRPMQVAEIGFKTDPSLDVYATVPYDMKVTMIDGSAMSMAPVRSQASELGLDYSRRCRFIIGTADRIALPSKQFDMIMMVNALADVYNPETSLSEIRRILRPGGVFVFFQYTVGEPGSLLRFVQERVWPIIDRGGYDLTRDYDRMISDTFQEVEMERYTVEGVFIKSKILIGRAFV